MEGMVDTSLARWSREKRLRVRRQKAFAVKTNKGAAQANPEGKGSSKILEPVIVQLPFTVNCITDIEIIDIM